jgi:biofilm PGA synthesis lipoprotein PgaB
MGRDFTQMPVCLLLLAGLLLGLAGRSHAGDATRVSDPHAGNVTGSGVVLLYHHVNEATPALTSITPKKFEAHLRYIEDNLVVWPLERLVDAVFRGTPMPERVVAITFDDAYADIHANAYPLLRKRDWPFTIFINTRDVGTSRQFLTWDQIRTMHRNGATLGNHSHTHAHLLRQETGELEADWRRRVTLDITRAGAIIFERSGVRPRFFAYPSGEYDERLQEIVKQLGLMGVGQQSGATGAFTDPTLIPRFPLGGPYTEMPGFVTKVQSLPLAVAGSGHSPLLTDDWRPALHLNIDPDIRGPVTCFGPGGLIPTRQDGTRVVARSNLDLPVGRSRYNCTAPADGGRFYWFSQLWIRRHADGAWYDEP